MVSRLFTNYFYFTEIVLLFCFSYKSDINHIVEALLLMSKSNNKLSQRILTDLLASLLILLSGDSNHQFDKHKRIIQHFLTRVF